MTVIRQAGFEVINLDVMVIAESPRIGPHVSLMRERIAGSSRLPLGSISIKATTNEGLGFAGRQEGIAALATATVLAPAI
jgi:2-C-methyl-D-erythritol 4-phosphate cytidylyltransferase/2-C-methyl-D-erythritol 2,4-cyclodiphosphate synthase